VAAGLLFLVIIAVQLGELRHVLRHSVWRHVYPLSDDQRERSLVKVTRAALGACSVLLWLPQAAALLPEGRFVPAFAALFIYGGYALLLRPHRLMRKIKREML
jgi:ABC-2 type transport system permease protein